MWKQCTKCGKFKALYMFYKHKLGIFGLKNSCIECELKYQKSNPEFNRKKVKRYRKRHPNRSKSQNVASRKRLLEKDPDYFRKWQADNKDKCRAAERRYSRNNPYKIAAKSARRRVKRKNQTVVLTDREKEMVQILYAKSQELGVDYVVDHITPVVYGGSDHPSNLQLITERENNKKSDMIDYVVSGPRIYWNDNELVTECK